MRTSLTLVNDLFKTGSKTVNVTVSIVLSLWFVVSVSVMGEYYTHRLIVQYTINQKGKVFQEFRKTQNQCVNPSPLPARLCAPRRWFGPGYAGRYTATASQ